MNRTAKVVIALLVVALVGAGGVAVWALRGKDDTSARGATGPGTTVTSSAPSTTPASSPTTATTASTVPPASTPSSTPTTASTTPPTTSAQPSEDLADDMEELAELATQIQSGEQLTAEEMQALLATAEDSQALIDQLEVRLEAVAAKGPLVQQAKQASLTYLGQLSTSLDQLVVATNQTIQTGVWTANELTAALGQINTAYAQLMGSLNTALAALP